jgi:hypothetical protein
MSKLAIALDVPDGVPIRWGDDKTLPRVGAFQPCPGGTPEHNAQDGSRYFVAAGEPPLWRWVPARAMVEIVEPDGDAA